MDICREIQNATGSEDVGVYVQATHGCCENRGIMATSSLTQTTVLRGSSSDKHSRKSLWIILNYNKVLYATNED